MALMFPRLGHGAVVALGVLRLQGLLLVGVALDDGTVAETRILTDKFVPVIRAWDMTPGSSTCGEVLTIR